MSKLLNRLTIVNYCYDEIVALMGESEAPDPDFFLECYGRMAVNSFNILDHQDEGIGSALYLGPSIMDHSCQPNASVAFDDDCNIVVRALEDIQSRDFRNIRISYIDIMDHVQHRQEHLLKNYYFLCQCPRCLMPKQFEQDMFAAKCPSCQSEDLFVQISANPEPCQSCGQSAPDQFIGDYQEAMELIQNQLDKTQFPLDLANFCLNLMDRRGFGRFHIMRIKTTEAAFDAALLELEDLSKKIEIADDVKRQMLSKALEHGLGLAECYAKFRTHVWVKEGSNLAKVAGIQHQLDRADDAATNGEAANKILSICRGQIVEIPP